ncbi:phosphate phosphoenolpyruvate translocator [Raphidocelis subcapitata]|uniref:Phosphate phosphoenolpyruvate translocator n=1 Tax=Raphidocelis subcapitata TaxID=307507 RepID=A0A2V0P4Q3_9CHLO|nr:phosphate phosphoenolpyruvate translocator [Raphidocelis subcapitata]|eukprot:GBF93892.1 phosphate phosphoenolpyruvate translocator [Raphidocelis subcapitata]
MGIACLFALVLFLSNSAFMYLPVPSIQMLKASGAATTFCIGMALGVERYCHMALLKVTVVGGGVLIASYGDANANLFGVSLQVGAILGDALRIILLQLVMQQSHVKLSPVASLFYIAPAAVLAFWLPVATIELPRLLLQDAPIPWVWLAISSAAATGLNLVGFTLISATSALTASISGPLKDWVCVVAAMAVFKTPVSTQQWCGYLVAFCGIAWYQYDKFWGQTTKSGAAAPATAGVAPLEFGSCTGSTVRVGMVHGIKGRPRSGLSWGEAIKWATDNVGNMMWRYGAQTLVDPNATCLTLVDQSTIVYTQHDVLLLPEANLLINESQYHMVAGHTNMLRDVLRKTPAPVLLLGIGSQVEMQLDAERAGNGSREHLVPASNVLLHSDQVDFLHSVEGRGGVFSVRGQYTADVCAANGVHGAMPLGCPSLFINGNPALGSVLGTKMERLLAARSQGLRVAVTLPHLHTNMALAFLASKVFSRFNNVAVIIQTPRDLMVLKRLQREHGVVIRYEDIRYFYDVQDWITAVSHGFDLVIGFRIHGTMAALAAAVPAVVIVQDHRILELAETMAVPHVAVVDPVVSAPQHNLFDLVAAAGFSGARFDAVRTKLARGYRELFARYQRA